MILVLSLDNESQRIKLKKRFFWLLFVVCWLLFPYQLKVWRTVFLFSISYGAVQIPVL